MEIDNNGVENAIRPTAVGKKNWLFVGHAEAGQRSAILFSLIESCRRRGVEPYAYLRDVLTRLPTMTNWTVGALTPAAWPRLTPGPGEAAPAPRRRCRRWTAYDTYESAGSSGARGIALLKAVGPVATSPSLP